MSHHQINSLPHWPCHLPDRFDASLKGFAIPVLIALFALFANSAIAGTGCVDADMDGVDAFDALFCPTGTDCDDGDANNFPGNAELCDGADNDCDMIIDNGLGVDADADGHGDPASCMTDANLPIPYDDCDDGNAAINPSATELPCDNVDNNCDTNIDENRMDVDGDTFDECVDCNDADNTIFPGAVELPCDNVDNNCDTNIDENRMDVDGDTFDECVDCNDADNTIFPGAVELPCDNVDNNCDTNIDENRMDVDGDTFDECVDCNDADNTIFPGAVELPCDNVDNNCDTNIDENRMDVDGDTFDECVDCNDADNTIFPGAVELPCDNVDNNCDTNIDENRMDADMDTFDECVDCDDADANNFPGNPEVCDAADNDCDTIVDNGLGVDADADGHGDPASCVTDATLPIPYDDCDDTDGNNFPTNPEVCDNADNDCDTIIDNGLGVDADADGHGDPASCTTDAALPIPYDDCDDADANNFPTNPEVCDAADNDCDTIIDNGLGVDADADGHGDPASCITDATLPIPYDDCDDADANNFPTNPEVCDAADNDCDTIIDNGLGVDADADGHGDPASCVTDATLPIPYDDCDDADGNNFPTNPEVCDIADNDCDTIIDNGLGVDADADGHGDPASCVTDATLPIPYDDCDDADANNFPTNPEVCDIADNDCDTIIDNGLGVDADADGHGDPASCVTDTTLPIPYDDCDDADGNNFPTNPEVCDAADNDCDTIADNGLGVDADADGHGDPASCVTDATLPIPYDDCDDADGNNFPTNPEVCDAADNDCDTIIDNGLGVDADADGHGDPASCVTDATLPIPYDDCDDADANNFPGNPEVCDAADNDCDTVIDNGLGVDADADGHGDPASCATDATLPIPYDDCNDGNAAMFPGNPEVCDMLDNNCDTQVDEGGVCNMPPVIDNAVNILVESEVASPAFFFPTASDAEDGNLTGSLVCTPASGSVFNPGATIVNCSVTDSGGKTANASFTVFVLPPLEPTLDVIALTGDLVPNVAVGGDGVMPGDPAGLPPTAKFLGFTQALLNENDNIMLQALIFNDPSINGGNNRVLMTDVPGDLRVIARNEPASAGTSVIRLFQHLRLSDTTENSFQGLLYGTPALTVFEDLAVLRHDGIGFIGITSDLEEGMPVPDVPGATFSFLWQHAQNSPGSVAMPGFINRVGGVTTLNDTGIWADYRDPFPISVPGDPLPLPLPLDSEFEEAPDVESEEAPDAESEEAPDFEPGAEEAIDSEEGPEGAPPIGPAAPFLLVREGDPIDPSTGFGALTYGQIVNRVTFNAFNEVAFTAYLIGVPNTVNAAIFFGTPSSAPPAGGFPLLTAVQRGDSADGTVGATFNSFVSEAINFNSEVAFRSYLRGGDVVGSTNSSGVWRTGLGIIMSPEEEGPEGFALPAGPTLVAREGDPAPIVPMPTFTAYYDRFTQMILADSGTLYYDAYLRGMGVATNNDRAIFKQELGGVQQLVMREGNVAPGITGGFISHIVSFAANTDGDLVSIVRLIPNVGTVTGSNNLALLLDRNDGAGPRVLLRKGDEFQLAPGDIRTVVNINIENTMNFQGASGGHGKAINNNENIAVRLNFSSGSGIFLLGVGPEN